MWINIINLEDNLSMIKFLSAHIVSAKSTLKP